MPIMCSWFESWHLCQGYVWKVVNVRMIFERIWDVECMTIILWMRNEKNPSLGLLTYDVVMFVSILQRMYIQVVILENSSQR